MVLVDRPEHVNEEVTSLIENELIDLDTLKQLVIEGDTLFATKQVYEFYRDNNFDPIWTNRGKFTQQSDSLFKIIKEASNYGLISNNYHYKTIQKLHTKRVDSVTKKIDAAAIAEMEFVLTDAFFTLAVHINKGRLNPSTLKREWRIQKVEANLVELLGRAIKYNQIRPIIDSLEPAIEQYQLLKLGLAQFKLEFKNIKWDSLLKSGSDSVLFNQEVKKVLTEQHYYSDDKGVSEFLKLTNAIKRFQNQHHLTEDGKVGYLTLNALQKNQQDYIRQIEVNMERWRYYDLDNEKKYILINIPKFEMRLVNNDTVLIQSRVIVGSVKMPTPILKSTIRYFIIYPYWTVPYSIASKEILPKLKNDPGYLKKGDFDVLDKIGKLVYTTIDWNLYTTRNFPFTLRQRIGEDNSLGILKFNFNNKYGVYLHDTNNHNLFSKDMRAMSHGCIRLEKSIELAEYLIRDDSIKYPLEEFRNDLNKKQQKHVYIKRPIPIFVNYFTVEADKKNGLSYFMDIYQRDKKMIQVLY